MAHPKCFWIALTASVLAMAGCGRPDGPGAFSQPGGTSPAGLEARASNRYIVSASMPGKNWERIERLTATTKDFPQENARPNGRQRDPELIAAFGSASPSSRDVLLHYASGWEKGQGTPVLLVHGVLVDANTSWHDPHGKEGLSPYLSSKGKRVFALTFAHRHGDNTLWAEQISWAIARIREVTGAAQVDVVAHSKGTVAARTLVSGVRQSWMTPYGKDVRKLVLLGGPHLGLDFPFRHPLVNYGLYPEQDDRLRNAPLSWTKMLVMGLWVDTSALSLMTDAGNYFPGQSQLLYRWDDVYPLPMHEQDWYTTYHGGRGLVSESAGISKAIAQGGHFIERLRKNPLDPGVSLAVLAGDKPDLAGVLNEQTGPADGVVFVKSATHTEDMTRKGAKLLAKDVLPLNHMELIYAPAAKSWLLDVLQR
ncbi:Lipase (class 2) [compost metagenome]